MRILLQFPQGLKSKALEEASKFEKEGHEVFLSATPCWGACDLALDEAKKLKADRLVHYGHAQFGDKKVKAGKIEIEYRLYPITVDLAALSSALPLLKPYKKLGLVTTVSHLHQLEDMKKILREGDSGHPHEVLTTRGALAILEGQVLGCDSSAADKLSGQVDALVYFGGGEFHPLGIKAGKPIFAVNPYANSAMQINDLILRKKKKEQGMLIAALDAKSIGILVSTKSGQFNIRAAENAKKKLLALGVPRVSILVTGEVDFSSLQDFNSFDAYITTACPRLVDDAERVDKPMVNLAQLPKMLQMLKELKGAK
ncbi:MAG: diphthamide biosynthesis enzyme Dph2 [Candidatus Marsarchaeota archaeon]|nr:diphthamide biosynthesis enzyme Dph2 [Candidatus Marsarchaeota archaeon]